MKIVLASEFGIEKIRWIEEGLISKGYSVVTVTAKEFDAVKKLKKYHKLLEMKQYYQIAKNSIKIANSEDIIICTCFTIGLLVSLLNKKNKVLSLNILVHDKYGIAGAARNKFYIDGIQNSLFFGTANSNSAILKASEILKINLNNKLYILHDPIDFKYSNDEDTEHEYVFSGGTSGRDWKTLCKICSANPNINFVVIAGKDGFDQTVKFPHNVKLLFDVPQDTFNRYLNESKAVIVPVDSEMTSGLLVIFQAILHHKLIVSNDTEAIRNYFPEELRWLLSNIGDADNMSENIKKLMTLDNNDKRNITTTLYNYNKKHNSRENYIDDLMHIITTLR